MTPSRAAAPALPWPHMLLALAVADVAWIGVHTDGTTTLRGLGLVLLAPAAWGVGNTISRAAGRIDLLTDVVSSGLNSVPPLLLLSLAVQGWPAIARGLQDTDVSTWAAVAWQAIGHALFGYAAWGWLLARHPAAPIVPTALLVPVFGMAAASLWMAEPMPARKMVGAVLAMAGLVLNLWWPRWAERLRPRAVADGGLP